MSFLSGKQKHKYYRLHKYTWIDHAMERYLSVNQNNSRLWKYFHEIKNHQKFWFKNLCPANQ